MENAYVRNADNGMLLSPSPVAFVRVPMPGELIFAQPQYFAVIQTIHGWDNLRNPSVEIQVREALHSTAPVNKGNPFVIP